MLWDARSGTAPTSKVAAHESEVNAIAFSPHTETVFITASTDKVRRRGVSDRADGADGRALGHATTENQAAHLHLARRRCPPARVVAARANHLRLVVGGSSGADPRPVEDRARADARRGRGGRSGCAVARSSASLTRRRAVVRPRRSHQPDHRHQLEPARPVDARLVLRGQRRPDLPAGAGHLDRQRRAHRCDRARVESCPVRSSSSCTNRLHAPRRPTAERAPHRKTMLWDQSIGRSARSTHRASSNSKEPQRMVAMAMRVSDAPGRARRTYDKRPRGVGLRLGDLLAAGIRSSRRRPVEASVLGAAPRQWNVGSSKGRTGSGLELLAAAGTTCQ